MVAERRGAPTYSPSLAVPHSAKHDGTDPRASTVVAIVEDDVDVNRAYSEIITRLGYPSAFIAYNGTDMLRALVDKEVKPNVILIDFRLPGLNGLKVGKRVHEISPTTKIIITTADDTVRDEAISLGFLFLQKPFSISQLAKLLEG